MFYHAQTWMRRIRLDARAKVRLRRHVIEPLESRCVLSTGVIGLTALRAFSPGAVSLASSNPADVGLRDLSSSARLADSSRSAGEVSLSARRNDSVDLAGGGLMDHRDATKVDAVRLVSNSDTSSQLVLVSIVAIPPPPATAVASRTSSVSTATSLVADVVSGAPAATPLTVTDSLGTSSTSSLVTGAAAVLPSVVEPVLANPTNLLTSTIPSLSSSTISTATTLSLVSAAPVSSTVASTATILATSSLPISELVPSSSSSSATTLISAGDSLAMSSSRSAPAGSWTATETVSSEPAATSDHNLPTFGIHDSEPASNSDSVDRASSASEPVIRRATDLLFGFGDFQSDAASSTSLITSLANPLISLVEATLPATELASSASLATSISSESSAADSILEFAFRTTSWEGDALASIVESVLADTLAVDAETVDTKIVDTKTLASATSLLGSDTWTSAERSTSHLRSTSFDEGGVIDLNAESTSPGFETTPEFSDVEAGSTVLRQGPGEFVWISDVTADAAGTIGGSAGVVSAADEGSTDPDSVAVDHVMALEEGGVIELDVAQAQEIGLWDADEVIDDHFAEQMAANRVNTAGSDPLSDASPIPIEGQMGLHRAFEFAESNKDASGLTVREQLPNERGEYEVDVSAEISTEGRSVGSGGLTLDAAGDSSLHAASTSGILAVAAISLWAQNILSRPSGRSDIRGDRWARRGSWPRWISCLGWACWRRRPKGIEPTGPTPG